MGKMNYVTVQANAVDDKPLGTRREANIKGLFASSPLYLPAESTPAKQGSMKLTPEGIKQWYLENVVNGSVPDSDGYYGFSQAYSLDFTGAGASIPGGPPNYAEVETGGGGLPSTPFVPNPASPGEGNGVNAEAKPEARDFAAQISSKKPSTPGAGSSVNDDARNPAVMSKAMKTLTLGQVLGQSQATAVKGK